jgi:tRNA/tmRNA/rRNA uracil-C5-methylase (TrmA/RlmC/RlmD family)
MARELFLDGTGQLLDVGCGPGVLELPLARLFDRVTALDPEPGMLQAGQRRCQQAGVANVRWVRGSRRISQRLTSALGERSPSDSRFTGSGGSWLPRPSMTCSCRVAHWS